MGAGVNLPKDYCGECRAQLTRVYRIDVRVWDNEADICVVVACCVVCTAYAVQCT